LAHYPSGLTVVSGIDAEGLIGFTCQSFFSVSLDPPLIAISVTQSSRSYPRLRATGQFAVSVLSASQQQVATAFARSAERGAERRAETWTVEKWRGVRWRPTAAGNPVIANGLMWLDCHIDAEHEAGDHILVVGRVVELCPPAELETNPLLYFRSRYHTIGPDPVRTPDPNNPPAVVETVAAAPGDARPPRVTDPGGTVGDAVEGTADRQGQW
jgi:flavin reductase (DIM6/NTAB) family NADH-FMN oxidoreductase RutF